MDVDKEDIHVILEKDLITDKVVTNDLKVKN